LEELGVKEYINYFGEVFSGTYQRKEWNLDKMENRLPSAAQWRRELQEEEREEMVNQLNTLQIWPNVASVQWKNIMEILVEQRQGHQQLKDEVEEICLEVVEF
jgi:hypothetical protein